MTNEFFFFILVNTLTNEVIVLILCVRVLNSFAFLSSCSCFQADVDNSGTIDYGEFIAATVHLNKLEREEHLVAAFQYFDKDGSGYITVDELQQACVEHNMTDVFLEDVIREVDQDNVSLNSRVKNQTFQKEKKKKNSICNHVDNC